MQRNRLSLRSAGVCGGGFVSHGDLVRFGSASQINRRFGQSVFRFGHADQMSGLHRGNGYHQSLRVGQADVFAGVMDDAASDVHRVFVASASELRMDLMKAEIRL